MTREDFFAGQKVYCIGHSLYGKTATIVWTHHLCSNLISFGIVIDGNNTSIAFDQCSYIDFEMLP